MKKNLEVLLVVLRTEPPVLEVPLGKRHQNNHPNNEWVGRIETLGLLPCRIQPQAEGAGAEGAADEGAADDIPAGSTRAGDTGCRILAA